MEEIRKVVILTMDNNQVRSDKVVPLYYLNRLSLDNSVSYDDALNFMKDDFLVIFMFTMKEDRKPFYSTIKKYSKDDKNDPDSIIKFNKALSSMITHALIEVEFSEEQYREDVKLMLDIQGMIMDLYNSTISNTDIKDKYRFLVESVEHNFDYLVNKQS